MYEDFSNCKLSFVNYGGSERKLGILINGERYMLKFQKDTAFGKRYNHISEFLGSHIFNELGLKTHETKLGYYKGEQVVACKDFVTEGYFFVPFNDVGESTIDEDINKFQYSYENILSLLEMNKKLTNVSETASTFFDMFIVDAFIGNFDRHGGNWGFLKMNNRYSLAPIFDNGSCLFPNLIDDDEIKKILNDQEELDRRVYEFPTSQIKLNDKKSSYYQIISSLQFEECNNALKRIFPRIDLNKIYKHIDELLISDIHKQFYKKILFLRYEKILKYSYLLLTENN